MREAPAGPAARATRKRPSSVATRSTCTRANMMMGPARRDLHRHAQGGRPPSASLMNNFAIAVSRRAAIWRTARGVRRRLHLYPLRARGHRAGQRLDQERHIHPRLHVSVNSPCPTSTGTSWPNVAIVRRNRRNGPRPGRKRRQGRVARQHSLFLTRFITRPAQGQARSWWRGRPPGQQRWQRGLDRRTYPKTRVPPLQSDNDGHCREGPRSLACCWRPV